VSAQREQVGERGESWISCSIQTILDKKQNRPSSVLPPSFRYPLKGRGQVSIRSDNFHTHYGYTWRTAPSHEWPGMQTRSATGADRSGEGQHLRGTNCLLVNGLRGI
jgi:hypothetical protein